MPEGNGGGGLACGLNPLASMTVAVWRGRSSGCGKREYRERALERLSGKKGASRTAGSIGPPPVPSGVGDEHGVLPDGDSGGEPGRRKMADDPILPRVDHANGVDSSLGHEQPAGLLVERHADRQDAAQRLQSRNADGNFGLDGVGLGVDDGDGIVGGVGDEDAAGQGDDSGRTAAAIALLPERNARADERLDFGRRGIGHVHHAQGARFRGVGVAQSGDLDGALRGLAPGAGECFGAGESECREGQPGGASLFGVGAGDGLVLEHAEIGDVEFPPVGGERNGKGEAAHPYRGGDLAGAGVDDGHAKVRLVHDVEHSALGIEGQVAGVAVVEAGLIEVDYAPAVGVPVEEADAARVPFGGINGVVVGEGEAHEDAAPIGGIELVERFGRSGEQLAHFPAAVPVAFQHGEGVPARTGVGCDHGFARRAHRQAERSGTGDVFVAKWSDDAAAGKNGCAGAPQRRTDTRRGGIRLRGDDATEGQQRQAGAPGGGHLSMITPGPGGDAGAPCRLKAAARM